MLLAACAEYAIGGYIIRKLLYAGMVLHSLRRFLSKLKDMVTKSGPVRSNHTRTIGSRVN